MRLIKISRKTKLIERVKQLRADLARRDASLLTEGEQKEILSYIRGNYDRDKIPTWLLDLIDGIARRDDLIKRLISLGDELIANEAVFASQEQADHYTVVIDEWEKLKKGE